MKDESITWLMALMLAGLLALCMIGILSITQDSRPFKKIIEDCKQYGRLQNSNARINCTVVEE